MKNIENQPDYLIDIKDISKLLKKSFSVILVFILFLAILNIFQLQKAKQDLNNLVSTNIQKMSYGSIMRDSIRMRTTSLYKMLHMDDFFDRDDEIVNFYAYAKKYRVARDKSFALGITEIEKKLNEEILAQIRIAQPLTRDAAESMTTSIEYDALNEKVITAIQTQENLFSLLNKLNTLQELQTKQALKAVNENFTLTGILTLIFSIVVFILIVGMSIKIYRHVVESNYVLINKNVDLEIAYTKSEESTKTKSEFIAKMSHEIRTPLNGVMGMLQLLLNTKLDTEQKNYTDTALNSSRSLLGIINDILDFSKIEAGKIEIENIYFNFPNIINNVINNLSNQAKEKELTIDLEIKEVEEHYIGDSNRVSQILMNLLNNAIKFTEKGGVHIKISVNESTPTNSIIYFSVHDSGIGINDENKNKLFCSFNQADNSISRKYGGAGLGLTISKQLCSLMNGDIGVIDGNNGGSIFWFTIQLERTQDIKDNSSKPTQNKIEKSKTQILVVEDNVVNQIFIKKALENLNYESDLAENGKIALEKIQLKKYDIVLMDCQMPIMDGLEATTKIRSLQERNIINQFPIVAVTGNAMKSDKEKCIEVGMNDFLAKPFNVNDLSKIIERWLH